MRRAHVQHLLKSGCRRARHELKSGDSKERADFNPALPSPRAIIFLISLYLVSFLHQVAGCGVISPGSLFVLDDRGNGGTSLWKYGPQAFGGRRQPPLSAIGNLAWTAGSQSDQQNGGPRPASTACSWASCKHSLRQSRPAAAEEPILGEG